MEKKKIGSDEVLRVVKMSGPIVPNKIRQILKQDSSMIIGAMLSELFRKRLIGITHVKLGGSPLYYDLSKPQSLESTIKYLNEKDRITANLLKERKVLVDSEETPITRVSLRQIKDFAIPFKIIKAGKEEIAWRYFLISEDEARKIISPSPIKQTEQAREEKSESESKQQVQPTTQREIPKKEQRSTHTEIWKDTQTKQGTKNTQTTLTKQPIHKESVHAQSEKKEKKSQLKKSSAKDVSGGKILEGLKRIIREKKNTDLEGKYDDWTAAVISLLEKRHAKIISHNTIRKNNDVELIIDVPTGLSSIKMFCKAKKKKNVNDKDLAAALLQSQQHRLPCLFITTGKITKRAKEMLDRELKGLTLYEIKD